jgi:formate dehydrogenase subunit gamma
MASSDSRAALAAVLAKWSQKPGGLLPALHAVKDLFGCIPPQVVGDIAQTFNRSRAEVHGVITYYTHFRSQPTGQYVVQICRAEACKARGGDDLLTHAEYRLGCELHTNSANGRYTLEAAFCLGLCASLPKTARMRPGVGYTTFHFLESGVNVITTDSSDGATHCQVYKVTAVQVMPVAQRALKSQWQRDHSRFDRVQQTLLAQAQEVGQ